MSDKTLFILEKGLWDASKVIGAFWSLERAVAQIKKLVGEVEIHEAKQRRDSDTEADTLVFTCPEDAANWFPEWFRVTVVEACWE